MDDGTGVINCLCWKNEKWRESGDPPGKYIQTCTYVYMGSFMYITFYLKPVNLKHFYDCFFFYSGSCLVVPRASEQSEAGFNPLSELKKLREAQRRCSQLEIGETLRARGPMKISRQQREVMASTFCKCFCRSHQVLSSV